MKFTEMVLAMQRENKSCVCVGLDPDKERILAADDNTGTAKRKLANFCRRIVNKIGQLPADPTEHESRRNPRGSEGQA